MVELGRYKHYKGNSYEVLMFAINSETLEEMVVYRAIYDGKIWARPKSMWEEEVFFNGKKVKRFTKE